MNLVQPGATRDFLSKVLGLAGFFSGQTTQGNSAARKLASLLNPQDILLDVQVASAQTLFEEIGRHMEQCHGLLQPWVVRALWRREHLACTGVGGGVAIPHARVEDVEGIQPTYLRLVRPIPFGSPDGKPILHVLALLVPKQAADEHLKVLADATTLFSDPRFRDQLEVCGTANEAHQLIARWPNRSG